MDLKEFIKEKEKEIEEKEQCFRKGLGDGITTQQIQIWRIEQWLRLIITIEKIKEENGG